MAEEQETPVKRGRGRPRKQPLPEPEAPAPGATTRTIKIPTPKIQKKWLIVGIVLVVLGLGGWKYWQQNKALNDLKTKQTYNPSDTSRLVQEVSKIAILPSGEVPQVAEVKDISKLKDKPFFAMAQSGDKVLVYQKAKRVFIYRLSTRQMVNMADLTQDDPTGGQTPNNTPKQ